MKKLKNLLVTTIFLTSSAFALDVSVDTDTSKSQNREKSMSNTNTKTNEESYKTSINLTLLLADKINLSCTNDSYTLNDFGIGFANSNGNINLTKKEYLENQAKQSGTIKSVGGSEEKMKKYLDCLIDAGAILAQSSIEIPRKINGTVTEEELEETLEEVVKTSSSEQDFKIKSVAKNAHKEIAKNECTFYNSLTVFKCGNIIFDMTNGENKITYMNHYLFGDTSSNYGVTSNFDLSIARNSSEENSMRKSQTITNNSSSKQSVSSGKFIPTN